MSTVVVRGAPSGLAQEVVVGRHRLVADEPGTEGGTDAGPSPYDYLLVALGS
jgi:putative redox protein